MIHFCARVWCTCVFKEYSLHNMYTSSAFHKKVLICQHDLFLILLNALQLIIIIHFIFSIHIFQCAICKINKLLRIYSHRWLSSLRSYRMHFNSKINNYFNENINCLLLTYHNIIWKELISAQNLPAQNLYCTSAPL